MSTQIRIPAKRRRLVGSVKKQLLAQAREAALCAVKIFNDPLVKFKSETFIVLMVIAWTYLLHAYYRSRGIDYCYFTKPATRKIYDKTKSGARKHWELERCLDDETCPIDHVAQRNLRFLIGLRHEIEHHMSNLVDDYLSARYQACAVNFNEYIKKLFSESYGLDRYLAYSIQLAGLEEEQLRLGAAVAMPYNLVKYIDDFDKTLTEEEYNDPRFSYRLLFVKKLVNRPGQADRVIEFIDPNSDLAKNISKEYWVKKEIERLKFRAKDIVAEVTKAGFTRFRLNPEHVQMWKSEDGKNPAKGCGVEIRGTWYWYESWLKQCLELCEAAGDKYR
jgi:hypothetical protein